MPQIVQSMLWVLIFIGAVSAFIMVVLLALTIYEWLPDWALNVAVITFIFALITACVHWIGMSLL